MTTRPRLMIAPEPFVAQVNDAGSIRQSVGANGRVHVDRPSFFLVLHRTADPVQSLARHVAVTAPSYLIWGPDDDHAAASALTAIVAEMRCRFGHVLTWFNGATQGLSIFRTGLARYEGVQEGLGVFAE